MGDTIPVVIDSIKTDPEYAFTRCFYFCVENIDAFPDGVLVETGDFRGLLPLGVIALITGPADGSPHFQSPDQLDRIIEIFDQDDQEFYLNQNVLWVPNSAFETGDHEPHARGEVWRLSRQAFRLAYRFTEDQTGQDTFHTNWTSIEDGCVFSAEETAVFQRWDAVLLKDVITNYHDNRDAMLDKTERPPSPQD